ncbi:hypothetical protein T4B_12167 [Trichinella pseudospiralis]|uniref:Uncharacterized protein n=1 Tax=Trichinella pseudospiralis TaxID=6337 RepID=A0A0V1EBT1_TRIPS|nr:hypothetical protein T4A_3018 [Trichinella pseudospiralis]KRZ25480.1 hypothetical protein T4B_12167 [Trichinella pseudospiralis]KRZ30635.1 hypothetical protein T4C_12403 [Trichinella pseudospiralis]
MPLSETSKICSIELIQIIENLIYPSYGRSKALLDRWRIVCKFTLQQAGLRLLRNYFEQFFKDEIK